MRQRRLRGRGQRGVTLIELAVTVALMATGVAALLGVLSTIEGSVRSATNLAQLTSISRQAGDVLTSEQVAYMACEGSAPYGFTAYQTALDNVSRPAGLQLRIVSVKQSTGGTHTVNGTPQSITPINGCSNAGPADFGVQKVQFTATLGQSSITRVVYKRWN